MYFRQVVQDFWQGLAAELRGFNLRSLQACAALGAAFATVSAVLLADWLNLAHPYWAGITALVVSRTTFAASLTKGALRIVGTVVGCMLALVLIGACINNTFAMLCLIFFAASISTIVTANRGRDGYAWSMGGFMIVLVAISSLNSPGSVFDFAIYRSMEISLGVIVAVSMSAIFNPASSAKEAKTNLVASWECLAQALQAGIAAWSVGGHDQAHLAALHKKVDEHLGKLPGLLFEARVEGEFGPRKSALAMRLTRQASSNSRRLFQLLEHRPALLQGYAASLEPQASALAHRLHAFTRAVGPALNVRYGFRQLRQPVLELRNAVRAIVQRHHAIIVQGQHKNRSVEEMLAWNEFMRFADRLAKGLEDVLAELEVELTQKGGSENKALQQKDGVKRPLFEEMLVRQAVSLGLAMILVPMIWNWFEFPGATQIGVTSFIVLQPDPLESWRKGFLRLSGCITGGCIGLLLLGTPLSHSFMPWFLTYFSLVFLFSYLDHGDSRCSYVGLQAGIALTITLAHAAGQVTSLEPPLTRLCGIVAGFALMQTIHTLLGGYNPLKDLRSQLHALRQELSTLLANADPQRLRQALASGEARLKAARRSQDLLFMQGVLTPAQSQVLQEVFTDADWIMREAPAALEPPENADARRVLAQASGLEELLSQATQALGSEDKMAPWSRLQTILAAPEQAFASDSSMTHRLAREQNLSRQARMQAAESLMARKSMLQGLAALALAGERSQGVLEQSR